MEAFSGQVAYAIQVERQEMINAEKKPSNIYSSKLPHQQAKGAICIRINIKQIMILTDKDIAEYQSLVKKRFGIDIPKEKALKEALSLIQFVKLCVNAKQEYKND